MAKTQETETKNKSEDTRQFAIQRLYIKDFSFELPGGADTFSREWNPQMNLDIHTDTSEIEADTYEVILKLTVTVKSQDQHAFVVEATQAGIFTIKDFPQDQLSHFLGSYCPSILYPYVREAITNIVTKASFPQLVLAPINFDALYAKHLEQQEAEKDGSESNGQSK
ncbi:MAG: protein-export chaperone SecB [Legionellales bacterium]|nr:protein-export chaperone SecB [Legionellales bacterium]